MQDTNGGNSAALLSRPNVSADRRVVIARGPGRPRAVRTVRVRHRPGGWDVVLGVGAGRPNARAEIAAALDATEARAVADALLAFAERAERAHAAAVGVEELL